MSRADEIGIISGECATGDHPSCHDTADTCPCACHAMGTSIEHVRRLRELLDVAREQLAAAVLAEREACAVVLDAAERGFLAAVEAAERDGDGCAGFVAQAQANACARGAVGIRARGER